MARNYFGGTSGMTVTVICYSMSPVWYSVFLELCMLYWSLQGQPQNGNDATAQSRICLYSLSNSESASEAKDSKVDDQSLTGEVTAIRKGVYGDHSSLRTNMTWTCSGFIGGICNCHISFCVPGDNFLLTGDLHCSLMNLTLAQFPGKVSGKDFWTLAKQHVNLKATFLEGHQLI